MIYKNQIFKPVQIGDKLEGFVKRITDDNRIDLMLREEGYKGVTDSADVLLQLIKDKGGVLEIGDKSSPELIHAETQMSKNQFKRAAGVLLKRGVVDVEEFEIRLKK